MQTTQIVFHTSNDIGQLAEILGIVGDANVNILAYSGYSEGGEGVIHMVTEDNERIAGFLEDAGYETRQEEVLLLRERDAVGRGADRARLIAEGGINVHCAYATAVGSDYIVVYQVDDVDKLAKLLANQGE